MSTSLARTPFSHQRYTIKRPFFTLFGRKFHVYGPNGELVLFVRHKILALRDEWSVYTDDTERTALLRVKARALIALDVVEDLFDAQTNEKLGAVRNKGLKSMIRDTDEILGPDDAVIGKFVEDSNALLRRFFPILLGHWHMEANGQPVAKLDQVWRWFTKEFTLEITGRVDTRLAIACAMLLLMREIRRESR